MIETPADKTQLFVYDEAGNLIETTDLKGQVTQYSYDRLNRNTQTLHLADNSTEANTYDAFGDLTQSQNIAVTYAYSYTAKHQLKSKTDSRLNKSLSWTYDPAGNIDSKTDYKQTSTTTTYQYDPSGYRIKKTGTATNQYYLEGEHLEAIYNNSGVVQAQCLRGSVIDEIVNGYQKDSNGKLINFTYHHDALQSVLGQSGHEGSILSTQNYSAFGKNLSQTGTGSNAQKYTGREQDTESGFYYYRARYYDKETGRFISEDPKGFEAGINFYAYVNNNPVNGNDPSGELPLPVRLATGVIGAGASAIGSSIGQLADVNNFSVKNVGIAAGVGFVAGFTAPQTTLSSIVTGGISNIAQYGITQTINNQAITTNGVIANGITGLAGGYLGGAVSSASLRYAENSPWIDSVTARALNNQLDIQLNTAGNAISRNILGSIFSSTDFSSVGSASGGFVIYPNKSNTNMMKSVYEK